MGPFNSSCRLCGSESRPLFQKVVLGDLRISYFTCDTCGYTQTEEPYWLDRAYKAPIAASDTGLIARNIRMTGIVGTFLLLIGRSSGPHLDYAGGYGVFTRMMRDIGFDFYHLDPYTPNLFASGFEWSNEIGQPIACTAFEVLEHLPNPVKGMKEILETDPQVLITSTEVAPDPPEPDWWYLAPEYGQHVGFFQARTIRHLADAVGLPHVQVGRSLQVWSRRPIPALRWLAASVLGSAMLQPLRVMRRSFVEADSATIRARQSGSTDTA